MRRLLVFGLLLSWQVMALPENVEVWFLSEPKTAGLIFKRGPLFAINANNHTSCRKMGEAFFHPQFGLHEHRGSVDGVLADPVMPKIEQNKPLGTTFISNEDIDLISCDKDYYFDMFCGKASEMETNGPRHKLEIWIDTSTSLRAIDHVDKSDQCFRRSFVTRMRDTCKGDGLKVSVFNTSKKSLGSYSTLCEGLGLNDQDRLIRWIQTSNAKNLIVVTDINEMSEKLGNYLHKIKAKVKGGQVPMEARELLRHVGTLTSQCI